MHETPVVGAGPESVRVYRRTIRASLERVWENVLDWEHLPWLHRSTFARVELLSGDDHGWRANIEFSPALGAGTAEVEVALTREDLAYTTRTLSGAGAGTEIVTRLEPCAGGHTNIEVDFRVPGVEPEDRDAVGDAMQGVYATLWDEDEAMMMRRQVVLDDRGGTKDAPAHRRMVLGRLARLRDALPVTIEVDGRTYRVAEVGGDVIAFSALCPHRGGALDGCVGREGVVECPWHGYRFDVRTGASADGRGLRLAPGPVVRHDPASDEIVLVWQG